MPAARLHHHLRGLFRLLQGDQIVAGLSRVVSRCSDLAAATRFPLSCKNSRTAQGRNMLRPYARETW